MAVYCNTAVPTLLQPQACLVLKSSFEHPSPRPPTYNVTDNVIWEFKRIFFFVVNGPAADATDAPQPWGLLCNPLMKMINFFTFFRVMEHRWNEIDRGKPKYSGENRSTRGKTCPSATLSTTNPTWTDPGSSPGLRGERPATNRLSHDTALKGYLLSKP
jgi:hypothetical protein